MLRQIRFLSANCGSGWRELKRTIEWMLFLIAVLRGIVREYRRDKFHFDFEAEWGLRLVGRPILDIAYNDILVDRRMIFRFANGWGAIVTLTGAPLARSNHLQEISFPSEDDVWFEIKSEKQYRWRISDLCLLLTTVKNRAKLDPDAEYEERVLEGDRWYPMKWAKINTPWRTEIDERSDKTA